MLHQGRFKNLPEFLSSFQQLYYFALFTIIYSFHLFTYYINADLIIAPLF